MYISSIFCVASIAFPCVSGRFLAKHQPTRRTDGQLTLYNVDDAEAQERGAVCLDGSAPGFYYEPADTDADASAATKWVLAFKGGGWCWTPEECAARAHGGEGSAKMPTIANDMSVFGNGPLFPKVGNTFAAYHHVVLWYCDGGVFAGDREDPVSVADPWDASKNMTIFFRGRRVLDLLMDTLKRSYGLDTATEVLLTGGSAGAFSAYMHADKLAAQMPPSVTKFKVAPINGWFAYVPGRFQQASRSFLDEFRKFYHMQNLADAGPADCHAALADGMKCVFSDYSYAFSRTPIFPLQALDMFIASQNTTSSLLASKNLNCVMKQLDEKTCTHEDVSRVSELLQDVETSIRSTEKFSRNGEGGFLTSCNGHRLYESPLFYKVANGETTMLDALTRWWNLDANAPADWHLPCQLHDQAPYQCEPSC